MVRHRETYRNRRTQGHVMDMTAVGGHASPPTARSGCWGVSREERDRSADPWGHRRRGGDRRVEGGSDRHREWYLNLRASDDVDVQSTQAFRASWREPEGDERHRFGTPWCVCSRRPQVSESTVRHIPVVDDDTRSGHRGVPGVRPSVLVDQPTRGVSPLGRIGELYSTTSTSGCCAWRTAAPRLP